jgi:hypothetical protein
MCRPAGSADEEDEDASQASYRIVSVGQDCRLLLWDVSISEESVAVLSPSTTPRKGPFGAAAGKETRDAAFSFWPEGTSPPQQGPRQPRFGAAAPGGGSGGGSSPSGSPMASVVGASIEATRIAPALARADMPTVSPVLQQQ